LRLWLSLIVDFERGREGAEPPTLPNLDYKIAAGDSLLGPDPSGASPQEFDRLLVKAYATAKDRYLKSQGEEKKQYHGEVEQLRAEIRQWSRIGVDNREVLDWAIEFAEVFGDGGFDIVLANPPYVRQELINDKPALRQVYGAFYSGTADLYTYFYARAVQMLKAGGMLVFISSNKWLRTDYGTNLRTLLATDTRLETVIDFGDLPVFGAIAYPVIIVAQRHPPTGADVRVLTPKNLDRLDDLREHVNEDAIDVAPASLRSGGWSFGDAAAQQRMETMRAAGVPLGEYVKGQIYYGIKTGLNEAFVINGATRAALIAEDAKSEEVIKRFLRGRDVKRWRVAAPDLWLIFTRRGIDIDAYPAIKSHLENFKQGLTPRPRNWSGSQIWPGRKPGSYKWYEIQDEVAYYEKFTQEKLVFPDISKECQFSLDMSGSYMGNTGYIIPIFDLYLLGILNSYIVNDYYTGLSSQIQGGFLRFIRQHVEQIPIPSASLSDRNAIADLVQQCLNKRGIGCEAEEAEINERVSRLYGLTINA
ncbi:MAG: Eco57I restriction-modification methylase domain-containing protein, partial [Chloroflexota bacterium]|nr:Eco57I restriction-modification methylase domain-containing protein [Chloroflexota bacterium]